MKNLLKALSIFTLFISYTIDAQYVVKKDTISGTQVSITMDSRVDQLLSKQEDNCNRNNVSNTNIDTPKSTTPKIVVPNRELSNDEICRKNPKIMGYKIQVAVVKSNEEASKIALEFRQSFPSLKVEKDASLRPNYKILAGSYFTKQSASADLNRVKSMYGNAVAVQYRVFCVEAK
ncbi:SPOR domain-containing protein [Chryseobacterium sp. T1]